MNIRRSVSAILVLLLACPLGFSREADPPVSDESKLGFCKSRKPTPPNDSVTKSLPTDLLPVAAKVTKAVIGGKKGKWAKRLEALTEAVIALRKNCIAAEDERDPSLAVAEAALIRHLKKLHD